MAASGVSSAIDYTTIALLTSELTDTTDTFHFIDKIQENKGLPDGIDTEPHLWDEILKKEFLEFPTLFLPLILETHGKTYPPDVSIEPVGTEYSVERAATKELASIRSDIMLKINCSDTFHYESQRYSDPEMVYRMFEYDSQYALSCERKNRIDNRKSPNTRTGRGISAASLKFPYSTVLLLEGGKTLESYLSCKLHLPGTFPSVSSVIKPIFGQNTTTVGDSQTIEYSVAMVKVQEYDIADILAKKLYVLIPYMPIRFHALAQVMPKDTARTGKKGLSTTPHRTNEEFENAKKQLTLFYQDIILILNRAVKNKDLSEQNVKDILTLLRKAMIRVFYRDKDLLREVIHMTAPVLKLERELFEEYFKEYFKEYYDKYYSEHYDQKLKEKELQMQKEYTATLAQKDAEIQKWRSLALGNVQPL